MPERVPAKALPPARHEQNDIGLRFMASLLGTIGCTLLLLLGIAYLIFPNSPRDRRFAMPFPTLPAPALQTNPQHDMQTFKTEEMARLNSVGWVDRTAGVVHIPIEQAMRAVAAEGIAGWPADSIRSAHETASSSEARQ